MLASAGRDLRIMLPMVTELNEVRQTRGLIERESAHLKRHGHMAPASVSLGAMIEVPALLWQLDGLFRVADFVSVGSNDLMQFMTATDRANVQVANRFDPLSRPFLRALREILRAGEAAQVPVTLCGEMAGNPLAAMALVGLGYRSLSMSASAIGPVKAMTHALDAGKLGVELNQELDLEDGREGLRTWLTAFAEAEGVPT